MKHLYQSAFEPTMSCGHPEDPAMLIRGESLEDFISRYMLQFHYEETRHSDVTPNDLPKLDGIFQQIRDVITAETTLLRRDCFIHVLGLVYKVHLAIYHLRQYRKNQSPRNDAYIDYVKMIKTTLEELLRDSYEDEKRKLEVVFGLVEVIAELLIADIEAFGLNPDLSRFDEAKTIRKLIANLLTNLVFGNTQSKRRLCNYSNFVSEVTKIIENSPGLAVFYAALIRNLSWQADEPMKISLSRIVPALSSAAIKAHSNGDSKCLLAILSALWNLGSHSTENKKAMCETEGFLTLIISLLDCDPGHTTMVENASGILKYACAYIVTKRDLLQTLHNAKLIRQLLNLLNSSSFTVVINALNALSQLAEHDPYTQMKLTKNHQAMSLLDKLRNSVQDDVRNTVKQLMSNLHTSPAAGYAYSMPRNPAMMYYSTTSESAYSSGGSTMLPMRPVFPQYPISQPVAVPQYTYAQKQHHHHQSTLPKSMKVFRPEASQVPVSLNAPFLKEVHLEAGHGIPESLLGTRSGSLQSLTDDMATDSSWRSYENTDAPNSAELSPVSESELPDSPTEFAMKQAAMVARQYGTRQSRRGSEEDEDLYGLKIHGSNMEAHDEALSRAIVEALPKPSNSRSLQSTPRMPKPSQFVPQPLVELPRLPDCTSDVDFDDSSVADEPMLPPSLVPSSSNSDASAVTTTMSNQKNLVTSAAEPQLPPLRVPLQVTMTKTVLPSRELYDAMKASSLLQSPSTLEKLRDASHLFRNSDGNDDKGELSDDSYCCSSEDIVALEDLTAVPDDVDSAFQAEKVVIDCASLSLNNRPKQSSKLPRSRNSPATSDKSTNVKIGLLSAATIKRLTKSRNPLNPPKTTKSKSARVSPFNYKEPAPLSDATKGNSKSQKLLVTTV